WARLPAAAPHHLAVREAGIRLPRRLASGFHPEVHRAQFRIAVFAFDGSGGSGRRRNERSDGRLRLHSDAARAASAAIAPLPRPALILSTLSDGAASFSAPAGRS